MNSDMERLYAKYLAGEADASEIREIENMMERDPEEFAEAKELWALAGALSETKKPKPSEVEDVIRKAGVKAPRRKVSKSVSRTLGWLDHYMRVAAVLLPLICLAYAGSRLFSAEENKSLGTFRVPNGSVASYELLDGSEVELNAGSSLTLESWDDERKVNLSGEALFRVAKNDDKPFWVITDGISVRVTGTVFNVKAYSGEAKSQVSLLEGGVDIYATGADKKELSLVPGEKVVFDAKNKSFGKYKASGNESEWTSGRERFEELGFADLATLLGRMYDLEVKMESKTVQESHMTGSLNRNHPIEDALDLLQLSLPEGVEMELKGRELRVFDK
ncbi:iron dicitrate transporter FecR [Fulvitalea axinellae]|uniref:Iron dicitrate transporter FecR n=1 Tax=Fulvitalea axinellae TaxID=1182444 RepID=A0AAU9CF33_9BACT|nr:iron dicitrate transporter FecR [Fulvitalea axinellae]